LSSGIFTANRAAELRRVFDEERALPFGARSVEQAESLISIRVSGDAYVMRTSEISGLVTDRKIVGFPTPVAELLGIAAVRGVLLPVYSLAGLLGYSAETEQTRWLVLCGTEEPLALAFNDFEGYLRVPLGQFYAAEQKDAAQTRVKHVVRDAEMVRAVVSIPLIREAIQTLCGKSGVSKER
jgi:chemotaxis signal transduction protein